jgi:cell division topological specificity factor
MFESIMRFFRKVVKKQEQESNSKSTAKERLHLVLMQDRANVSADFLELMKQEIIEVIKKYIDVDEGAIDVRLTNKENEDGTNGAPALYANIPILNIKDEVRKTSTVQTSNTSKQENKKEQVNESKEVKENAENKSNGKDKNKQPIEQNKVEEITNNVEEEQTQVESQKQENEENKFQDDKEVGQEQEENAEKQNA